MKSFQEQHRNQRRGPVLTSDKIRPAKPLHGFLVLPIWFLSFPGAGRSFGEARKSMQGGLPEFLAAARGGRAMVMHGGRAFAWWEVQPDGNWYLNYIASFPRGGGQGSALLNELLRRADQARVSVVLHCSMAQVEWYQRNQFRIARSTNTPRDLISKTNGLMKMRRTPKSLPGV